MTPFPKTDLARLLALPSRPQRAAAILSALRFVAGPDLALAGLAAADAAALAEAGEAHAFALQRRMTDAEPVPVLALARAGAFELARGMDIDPATVSHVARVAARRSSAFMDHTLARSRFALWLAARFAADPDAGRLLSWETDPERLADAVLLPDGVTRQPLVADGLALVATARGPEGLLVEIDRGTERPNYLGRKYAGYAAWWRARLHEERFSVRALRVLTVAPDARRAERLLEACRQSTGGAPAGLFWFGAEDRMVPRGVRAPVWKTMRRDHEALWP